ncbi:MAG TPA: serine hydrolase domain-containing protein [Blastocatellia bacterium]|nr:serine hydrolase domain-containing protein [Blastocatellia bacterium]
MKLEKPSRLITSAMLGVVVALTPLFAALAAASSPSTQAASGEMTTKLAAIEKAIDDKRKELGVPGLSLAIVKDDRVIYAKGLGLKDVEGNLPATEKTLFAIGSCSKAFTAMAAVMSVDDGKLSLEDSPRKHIPYFKLQDPDADAKVTVRDLLCHRSGLDGTDLLWFPGVLNREEVIKGAGAAKPTAKLGEKFQYQNVMFSAAGEVVAHAQHSTWEQVISQRIFKPIGMSLSNTSKAETMKSPDFAIGYDITKKPPKRLVMRDLTNIAPAGAINSNAVDMAKWLRLMLGAGVFEGKRLVSEKGFSDLTTKQITISGATGYALGWGVMDWNGHKVLTHSGGIDGFNSMVAVMPDQQLAFCVLTNVTTSRIGTTVRDAVFNNIIGKPEAAAAAGAGDPAEAGSYSAPGLAIDVVLKDGKLFAKVAGQPDYPLLNVGGRKYKLGDPAPNGFFMTFRAAKENESQTEMFLEQPQGNVVLVKSKASSESAAKSSSAEYSGPNRELIGKYERDGRTLEVASQGGKLVLLVPGQPAYTLVEKEKDSFGAAELPDTYRAAFKRNSDGRVSALLLKQPEGEFELTRTGDAPASVSKVSVPIDEVMAKVIAAAGGEANLRKHKSMITNATIEMENQGLSGETSIIAKAPNSQASKTTFTACGKKAGTMREYFDGTSGGSETSFLPPDAYADKQLEDARIASDFYQLLNWKTLFKSVTIKEKSKVGDEEVYVIVKASEKGNDVLDYVSTKTFLLLKRNVLRSTIGSDGPEPTSDVYSDYRLVDGVMIPFLTTSNMPGFGSVITRVKEVKFDVALADNEFRATLKR